MLRRLTTIFATMALTLAVGCNRHAAPSADEPASTQRPASHTETGGSAEKSERVAPDDVPTDDINIPPATIPEVGEKLELTKDEWRDRLTKKQFGILRNAGTEYPGTGVYNKFEGDGTYHCSACNNPLFSSETKFDSGTGWPSFYAPIEEGRVGEIADRSAGMVRTEVVCDHCGGHLGHVFTDGPEPTGLRYCINSVSLYFRPE